MVKTLTMTCPHCNQISDLYLSTNACVIVLNCPSCYSPIMYFENKMFLLSENQVNAIKGTTQNATVLKILDKIAHPESMVNNTGLSPYKPFINPVATPHLFHNHIWNRKYISEDDITNLRIELGLCTDCQSFIDKL